MPIKNTHTFFRAEKRIPMEIPVMLAGHRQTPGTESTFTENVSARGARVVSVRNWKKGEKLTFASRTGEFRSSARVAYCQPLHGDGYAVGVEFLETKGRWVV
jgi:PilZ domain